MDPRPLLLACVTTSALPLSVCFAEDHQTIHISSDRQLFVDDHLIEKMSGATRRLHRPVRREIAIKPEHPWESGGIGVSYMVTFREGDRFRAWYRCAGQLTGYAESTDGVRWEKPKLGLVEFRGSKDNNIVWTGPGTNMCPFRDGNPDAPPEERYKAIVRTDDVLALVSPDGLRWRLMQKEPILDEGMFDSHNIAFWDNATEQYVAYTRGVRKEGKLGPGMARSFVGGGVRWVRRSTSKDFRHWSPLEPILTDDAHMEEFYTNAAIRYDRAPQYVFMFPSRFVSGREPKPGWEHGKGVNDIAFLSSRDGIHFDRSFMEAFVRPGLDDGNWHERGLYMERGILQTSPTELSLYGMENWRLDTVHIRRFTLRVDGFVSVNAGYKGGEFTTKPMTFSGDELGMNYSTSAVGSVRVEIRDTDGRPIAGHTLRDCPEIFGDQVDRTVAWKNGADVSALAGRPIRLRFVMRDADLYSFRFKTAGAEPMTGQLSVTKREVILENTEEQLHFPFLHEAADGMWYMTYRRGAHAPGKEQVQCRQSEDRGATWKPWPGLTTEPQLRLFRTRLRDGTLISHRYTLDTGEGAERKAYILRSKDDGKTWKRQATPLTDLPFDPDKSVGLWDHILEMPDGRLLCTLYGRKLNGKRNTLGVVESADGGSTWRYLATVCDNPGLGPEGPDEADLVLLKSGKLLSVFRTGGNLFQVSSSDGGQTWSKPKDLGTYGVSPQLLLLDNGLLILTYGTRNVCVRASWDGTGETWSEPLTVYEGPGSGYTDLQTLSADCFRMVYDESPFFDKFRERWGRIVRVEVTASPGRGR